MADLPEEESGKAAEAAILAVAFKRWEKAIRKGFEETVAATQKTIVLQEISDAVAVGNVNEAVAATRPDVFEAEMSSVTNPQRAAYTAGATTAHDELPPAKKKKVRPLDIQEPQTLEALRRENARMVTDISAQTRAAITETLEEVIIQGVSPTRAARKIKGMVGLNRVQAGAIRKQTEALQAKGMNQQQIDKTIARRTKKMLKRRAETIARTESARAIGEGRQGMWDQMANDGDIEPGDQKRWVTSLDERVGTDHRPMHGVKVPVQSPFFIPETGQSVQAPPSSRPSCRCTATLIFA